MRTHTSQFKEEIKQYGRQFSDNIYYNNTTYNGDHIFSVNYSVDTTLCKSIMQSLRIDTDISLNVGDTLDYGISLENTTDEIRFNNFIVNKIEEQKDKKSNLVTCYDNMIKAMKDYESFYNATTDTTFTTNKNYYQLDNGKYKRYTGDRTGNPSSLGLYQSAFPMTIREYLSAICSKLGLTFRNASDTFTNYNKEVTSEHYVDVDGNSLGYTFRDTLDDIAEATGSFIRINNNGQLEVKDISDATGKNIFNSTSVVQGYIDSSTSKVSYNTGYRVSTFKIEPNTTYTISKRKNSYNYIGTRQTNTSGTLSNVTNMQDYTTTRVKATITTGANDNYLFIDLGPTNSYYTIRDSIQVEIGTEVTNFEPCATDTINEEYFKDKNVNVGKKIGPYNVVVLSREDVDNIYYPTTLPSNPIEFKISDNAILDQDNREDFIQGIYNKINGLEFYLNDFATNGILYYEIGDKYNVSLDNVTYPCLLLNDDIKRTTGLKENILTNEPKQSVTEFKYASSTDRLEKQSRNAVIKVDKANASIEQIVSAVGDNGQVTSASIIQSINNDTSQIEIDADKIDLNANDVLNIISGNQINLTSKNITIASTNFNVDSSGNLTCSNATINEGQLELKDNGSSNPSIRITSVNNTYLNKMHSMGYFLQHGDLTTSIFPAEILVRDEGTKEGAFIYNDLGIEHFKLDSNDGTTILKRGAVSFDNIFLENNGTKTFNVDGATGNATATAFKTDNIGQVGYQKLQEGLQIKEAANTEAPNNGVVLEYSKYSGWGGQLYIGDNADAGLYYNGWSNGTRSDWKRVAFQNDGFSDTSGNDWQEMLRNKIDYCINSGLVPTWNGMAFINGGWSGINYGFGLFSKLGSTYQLVWFSSYGISHCIRYDNGSYSYSRNGNETGLPHPSNNLNDFKTGGKYTYDNGASALLNSPTNDGIHILNVITNGGYDWIIQEDYVLRWGSNNTEKYIRQYGGNTWSAWQKII